MLPALRFHRPTNQYYVWDRQTKKRVHFGRDPAEARRRYAIWLAGHGGPPALAEPSRLTVAGAVEAYRRYAAVRYTDPREAGRIALALEAVVDLYGSQPAATFRAKALREVRARLIRDGKARHGNAPRSRHYVNKLVRAIQTAWRWLASEELVPAEAAAAVGLVRALSRGDGGVELTPVLPPPPGAVEATLPYLPATVAAMVQVQLLTGARPGEICQMRVGEISRHPDHPVPLVGTGRLVAAVKCSETTVWVYSPGSHKTLRRGKSRVILIGPKAQAVLSLFLAGKKAEDVVFQPQSGSRVPYRPASYAKAVQRAIKRAGCSGWSPLSLRHAAATEIAERFDGHTAAAVLGHAPNSPATRVYVEQSVSRAAAAAAQIG